MKKYFSTFVLISFIFISQLYAQIKVLSPIPGVWANKQMLVIDNSDGEEYYYSLNGQDPISFGFAYDNPILIDLTGNVSITIKKAGKSKEQVKINYTVQTDKAYDTDYYQFIDSFYDTGVLNYSAGSEIYIPSNLYYSLNLPPDSFIPGQSISISENTVLEDFVPCVLYDDQKDTKWRFIIRIFPQNQGIFTKEEVPFEIVDWDTIYFLDDDYIYRIDTEYWELPKVPKKIDRSVSHRLQWQSIDYEQGNPIQTFELPPKPSVQKSVSEDGGITFSIQGDSSYQMGILSDKDDYQELYSEIGADTFYGNNINGELTIGVFSNSVYQGNLKVAYEVNKKPPSIPFIEMNAPDSFYSRQSLAGTIIGQQDSELYVSISKPYLLPSDSETYSPESEIFRELPEEDFNLINGNEYRFLLDPIAEGACYYHVRAYSKKGNVTSSITEFSIIIDKYNYYYDESYNYDDCDGTKNRPYNNFEQCFSSINNGRNAVLNIIGTMHIPAGKNNILSNCTFVNLDNAQLVFEDSSSLIVKNSTLSLKNFTIIYQNESSLLDSKITNLFKLENSVLDIFDCQIGANFGKNAYLIDMTNSYLNIQNSIISVSATDYVSFVNGSKSHLYISKSNVNTSGKTCVGISLYEGDIKLLENSFKVTGSIGRISELFDVKGSITNNKFTAELPVVKNSEPVFSNNIKDITISDNESYGF